VEIGSQERERERERDSGKVNKPCLEQMYQLSSDSEKWALDSEIRNEWNQSECLRV
jgi:hypothetical protein